ncbi:MAG: HdeD family acid-resistance protein [Clostridiales bacterium]|nr:HdeD family acid-resistance protein [Clostridiales bacterium]MDD7035490.1 HdeD family acid-resistance protein [Bacillota bacterium]MDY2919927.1 HdeD family acid-resistance protein [Lentihominibacter sp.]
MRGLTIASGILMVATGVFCFINRGQTFLTMAFIVGTVMMVCGLIHTISYFVERGTYNRGDNNGWVFTDAVITLLLGVMVLFNQLVVDSAIPMVFGMWVLVSGILRIEASTHINREKKPVNFRGAFITGIVTTVVGIVGFINPFLSWLPLMVILGAFMIVQGINSLELGINMPHKRSTYVKIYRKGDFRTPGVAINDEVDESREAVKERLINRMVEDKEKEFIETVAVEDMSSPGRKNR